MAGHETTANGLTWTFYLLSQSPAWRERAEAEADETFDPLYPALTRAVRGLRAVFEKALASTRGGDAISPGDRRR